MPAAPETLPAPHGPRLWLFRVLAAVGIPLLLLGSAELALRLADVGHPTSFLVPSPAEDGVLIPNPRFGYRFFPPSQARAPVPFRVREEKPPDSLRIFVVGGSAALGTPESAFGLSRLLQRMFARTFPGRPVEVHNAAMTAVNSHVVLPIVRDLSRVRPDLFLVYLGNNEVVGPFGAATVFGRFSPDLRLIRSGVALRATRIGQVLARALGEDGAPDGEWKGMETFVGHEVAADDPRLDAVVSHFERNLDDLVTTARSVGAEVILSTVAVNLRDQSPFRSLHRPDLGTADRKRWQAALDDGVELLSAGRAEEAEERFAAAARIDDRHAELWFHRGRARAVSGDPASAREAFERARDLDALRFRSDSRLQETVRRVARDRDVALVDAAELFASGAASGGEPLPGARLFHEHVHLRPEGNVALARAFLEAARSLLGDRLSSATSDDEPPALADLVPDLPLTTFDVHEMEQEILRMVSEPPFTERFGQEADLERRRLRLAGLRRALGPAAWRRAESLYRQRIEERPEDLETRKRFATLLGTRGEHEEAAEQWRLLLERVPDVLAWRGALADRWTDAGRFEEAERELRSLLEDWPEHEARHRTNLGVVLEAAGRPAEARDQYRLAVAAAPDDPRPRWNLATSQGRGGDLEGALRSLRELVERHPDFAPAHHDLGVALERQGALEEAAASYRRAIELSPGSPNGHVALGSVLEKTGDPEGADREYRRAIELRPDHAPAHFRLADLLLAYGWLEEARIHYDLGLAVDPTNERARLHRERAARGADGVDR